MNQLAIHATTTHVSLSGQPSKPLIPGEAASLPKAIPKFDLSVIDPALRPPCPDTPPSGTDTVDVDTILEIEDTDTEPVEFGNLSITGSLEGKVTQMTHEAACLQMHMPTNLYGVARYTSLVLHNETGQLGVLMAQAHDTISHGYELLALAHKILGLATRKQKDLEQIQMCACVHSIKLTLKIVREEMDYMSREGGVQEYVNALKGSSLAWQV